MSNTKISDKDGMFQLEPQDPQLFKWLTPEEEACNSIIEDVDFSYLEELKNKINKFNPEVVILKNTLPDEFSSTKVQSDNNLIVIRKV